MGNRSAQSTLPCFVIKLSGTGFAFVSVVIFLYTFFFVAFLYEAVEISFSSPFLSFITNGH
jgi:hypothetical protein